MLLGQYVAEPVGIVAPVAEQPLGVGYPVQKHGNTDVITELVGGHQEAQGAAVGIGYDVERGIHAAFGADDRLNGKDGSLVFEAILPKNIRSRLKRA